MKQLKAVLLGVFMCVVLWCGQAWADDNALKTEADRLHSVLEAARTTYATDIVNRLQDQEKVIRVLQK